MRLPPSLVALLLVATPALALAPDLTVPEPAAVDPNVALPALAEAQAMLHSRDWLGKDPAGWIDWARANLAPLPAAQGNGDLVAAVEALYVATGVPVDAADIAQLRADAAKLEPAQAHAIADLVATMARVYASQEFIATQVDLTQAMVDGVFRPSGAFAGPQIHALEAQFDAVLAEVKHVVLPPAAAQASLANGEELLAAAAAFRVAVEDNPSVFVTPFTDPLGLVIVGSLGADTFVEGGILGYRVLVADPGGNDLDLTNAGGACPLDDVLGQFNCNGLAAALRVDVAGDDTYRHVGQNSVAQGAGALGGLGVLADFTGSDLYEDVEVSAESEFMYYWAAGAQGSGEGGVGLMLDAAGADTYFFNYTNSGNRNVFLQGQGFAGLGGIGALLDGEGDDWYESYVICTSTQRIFCGTYILGTALYPGVAVALDGAGNDFYRGVNIAPQEDYYSQSFAAFGGLGIEVDLLGDDIYIDSAKSTNPSYSPSLNCAYASAMYAGAGSYFLDLQGDDSYYSETITTALAAKITSESYSLAGDSLFWDVSGEDEHRMKAQGVTGSIVGGRGKIMSTLDKQGVYIDSGGVDIYADIPAAQTIGADNMGYFHGPSVVPWPGIDVNLVPSV